jgi:hypothetical protein
LDQADWQHLREGIHTSARERLLHLAAEGVVRLAISYAHVLEIGGMESGSNERLLMLGTVPGLFLFDEYPDRLMERSAYALTSAARRESFVMAAPAATPATTASLREACAELKPVRGALNLFATFRERHRQTETGMTSADHARSSVGAAAIARGDADAVIEVIRKQGAHVGPVREKFIRLLSRAVSAVASLPAVEKNLGPISRRMDQSFVGSVLPHLDEETRASRSTKDQVFRLWSQQRHSADWASLVAHAAVSSAQRTGGVAIDRSAVVDRLHSVFAPWCSVFTCDKRNADPLRRALSGLSETKVVRTRQLDHVALAALELGRNT